jgi:hypothetical protein
MTEYNEGKISFEMMSRLVPFFILPPPPTAKLPGTLTYKLCLPPLLASQTRRFSNDITTKVNPLKKQKREKKTGRKGRNGKRKL